ncbi:MAG: TolC family protein, partial [Steroidobacteraceae bacterium]
MNVRKTWPLLAAVAAVGYLLLPYRLVIAAEPAAAAAAAKDRAAPLTLSRALALALKHNPELSAFSHELRASEAAVLQAGVLPNPVLELEADNLDNNRLRQDGDRTTAIQIGQLIELGGKRTARIRMAEAGRDLANWDYEAKRIDVLSRVSQHFIDTVAAQQARELAAESLKLARNVAAAVARRVQAGKVSPIEET